MQKNCVIKVQIVLAKHMTNERTMHPLSNDSRGGKGIVVIVYPIPVTV